MMESSYTGRDNLEAMREAHRYNESILDLVRGITVPQDVVVDFGAGIGTFAAALAAEGLSVHCVETDVLQASVIREMSLPVAKSIRDFAALGIDVIYTFNVLEHIEDEVPVIAELFAALKPGGQLVVYVPAFPILYSSMDQKVGHVRRYTRKDLKKKLDAVGFDVQFIRYADSLGFFAALAYRLFGNDSGEIDRSTVGFYDRWVFPVSRMADKALSGVIGKNVVALARKPQGKSYAIDPPNHAPQAAASARK